MSECEREREDREWGDATIVGMFGLPKPANIRAAEALRSMAVALEGGSGRHGVDGEAAATMFYVFDFKMPRKQEHMILGLCFAACFAETDIGPHGAP